MARTKLTVVTMYDFLRLFDYLEKKWDPELGPDELSNAALGGKGEAAWILLEQMAVTARQSGEASKPAEWPYTPNMLGPILTQVKKALQYAATQIGFDPRVRTTLITGQSLRVVIDRSVPIAESLDRPNHRSVKHIFWLKNAAWGEYVDLLIRGARFEAEANGVSLHVLKADPAKPLLAQAEAAINETSKIKGQRVVQRVPKGSVFVLDLIDLADLPTAAETQLSGFRVISSGYPGATIAQDNHKIGRLAACALAQAVARNSACFVAIICPSMTNSALRAGPVKERVAAFRSRLKDEIVAGGFKCKIKEFDLPFTERSHPHELCTSLSDLFMSTLERYDTIGIFSTVSDFTGLFSVLSHVSPIASKMRVVSADITPTLVAMLADEHFPLEAICGVDALEYGRQIIRTACAGNANLATSAITAAPTLLTRKDSKRLKILQTSEVLAYESELRKTADRLLVPENVEKPSG